MTQFINPYTDFGFKWLFGTEKNKALLIDFLNAMFDGMEHVEDLEYRQHEHIGAGAADRHIIFDVYCVTSTGEHIIVEMQNVRQNAYRDRMLFYAAAPIREQAPRGAWNFELKRVYSIGIMNFTLDKADLTVPDGTMAVEQTETLETSPSAHRYRHVIQLMDVDTKEIFSKTLTFIYVEMPRFTKAGSELKTLLDKWLYAIKSMAEDIGERPETLTGATFDQLYEQARYANLDIEDRHRYDRSLMDMWDVYALEQTSFHKGHEAGLAEGEKRGREVGLAEGCEEGEKNARRQIAKSLLAEGIPVAAVAKMTGLELNEVEKL
ncbi:MAG: Rpn family recombination-promoting nuclease/putative transposase [Proteobacteria bacterium]|nr:Rpn family recombination-promoting nuclease/putative transposase [Pseudomonadota bacterium]